MEWKAIADWKPVETDSWMLLWIVEAEGQWPWSINGQEPFLVYVQEAGNEAITQDGLELDLVQGRENDGNIHSDDDWGDWKIQVSHFALVECPTTPGNISESQMLLDLTIESKEGNQ